MVSSLPTNAAQWNSYFDKTFKLINDVLPEVIFGTNKFNCFCLEITNFRQHVLSRMRQTNIPRMQALSLFEFFKTTGALISTISEYNSKNWLKYFLSNPLNEQYKELSKIWSSFQIMSYLFCSTAFADNTPLQYAHYLDLLEISRFLKGELNSLPANVKKVVQAKIDEITIILSNPPQMKEGVTPGILSHEKIQTDQKIGQGAFATVFLAHDKDSGEKFALKELKNANLGVRNILSLQRELNALLKMKHPNVLKFIGVTITPPFCIATALVPNGSLFDLLHKKKDGKLDEVSPTLRTKIGIGLARGLEYMSAKRFVHRDFKTQNVLLNENNEAIICDFGISRIISPHMTTELGTVQYAAPEILNSQTDSYDSSADTYAYAITMWELMTTYLPYGNTRVIAVANMVMKNNERPVIEEQYQSPVTELIQQCWAKDPKARPKMERVRKLLETESGNFFFKGADKEEVNKWIKETRPAHEAIMKKVYAKSAKEESIVMDLIHSLNPLDSTGPKIVEKLYQFEFPVTQGLLKDLLRLVNQNLSINLQEIAFDVFKTALIKNNTTKEVGIAFIIDGLFELMETEPQYMIGGFKCIANDIPDPIGLIKKVLTFTQSHYTVELIQIIITSHSQDIKEDDIIEVYHKLTGGLAVSFYRFMVFTYKTSTPFLVIACDSMPLMSSFVKELAKECATNLEDVLALVNLDDELTEERSMLQSHLESISFLIQNPTTAEINEKTAKIIYHFLIGSCIKFKKYSIIMPLLCICARVGSLRAQLSSDCTIWNIVVDALEQQSESMSAALKFIDDVPLPTDENMRLKIWEITVKLYVEHHTMSVAKSIASIISRSHEGFDVNLLGKAIIDGLNSDDDNQTLSALKISRSFSAELYEKLWSQDYWEALIEKQQRRNPDVCKSIGKLAYNMLQKMGESFPIYLRFFVATLNLIYNDETAFESAYPSLVFLINTCKFEDMALFLREKFFLLYLHQLPFRYEDPRVTDALDFCTTTLAQFSMNK